MFRFTILAVSLWLWAGLVHADFPGQSARTYSEVEVFLDKTSSFETLAAAGLIFDHIKILEKSAEGLRFKTVVNSSEMEILKQSGLSFKVLIADVVQDFLARQKQIDAVSLVREDLPAGFEYGSMGGYYTFDEVVNELDSMRLNYPHLITAKQSIGKSIENRDLWMVKISDNPDVDEDEPEVFFTALHHAREPGGLMTLMYFMDYILEQYGVDAQITYLIDHREIYFVPVVNPDGYVYNEQTNPDGGGQWRKNRRPVQSWYGIDLNRNYGYQWGYDDAGSSPYPFSDTYRGSAPFSEPETQAIRDFVNGRNIKCVLNYHTYSNVLIYPWAYIDALTPDSIAFMEYGDLLTSQNRYGFGNCNQTINYNANGDADDWMYGEQSEKAKIFALTPEVGDDSDGFWPDQSRIVPLCKENLKPNLNLTWLAGAYPRARSFKIIFDDNGNGFAEPGEQIKIVCQSKNIGLSDGQNISVAIGSDLAEIQPVNSASGIVHASFPAHTTLNDTFLLAIDENLAEGSKAVLTLNYTMDGYTLIDTLGYLVVGTPLVVFMDNAENGLENWRTGEGWGLENDALNNGNTVFSDSPDKPYENNANNSLTLKDALQLPTADRIYLSYLTRWDVERVFDFATVQISTDSVNWETLQTSSMQPASGKGQQASGDFGYDGFTSFWKWEWIDITDYQTADRVFLRFRLQSDGGEAKDGWRLDNIQVLAYNTLPSSIADQGGLTAKTAYLSPAFPNPFNAVTTLRYYLPRGAFVQLNVFDVKGQKIAVLVNKVQKAGRHTLRFDASGLASGLYFIQLNTENQNQIRKALLLK
ncbi:M14 family zinc carboxypeptidase [Calditrichota bacterium LG25]